MDITALLLSRIQFAFTISFHIIFPSFTIGLAAWLTVLEALHLATGRPAYRVIFEFWLKIFGVAFGLGVVSGIVMAFQFGTNWSVLSRMSGPIQGPLLIVRDLHRLYARGRLLRRSHLRPKPRAAVVLFVLDRDGGAGDHAFGVLDHGQQQLDAGADRLCPGEWRLRSQRLDARSSSIRWSGSRFPHMLLASYLTGAFCVAATGAWYMLRKMYHAEARIMLRMGLGLAAVLVPVAAFVRSLVGDYVARLSACQVRRDRGALARRAAGSEVLFAWPDVENRAQPFRDHVAAAVRQPDRFGQSHRRRRSGSTASLRRTGRRW